MIKLLFRLIKQISFKSHIRILIVLAFVVIAAVSNLYIPLLLKDMVENLQINNQQTIMHLFMILALVMIIGRICAESKFQVYSKWECQLFDSALKHFYDMTFNNHRDFFEKHKTGSLTSRIFLSAQGLKSFLFDIVFHFAPLILEILLITPIIAIQLDAALGLFMLVAIFSYLAFIVFINKRLLNYQLQVRDATVESQGCLTDHLSCWKDIRLLNGKGNALNVFASSVSEIVSKSLTFYKKRTHFGIVQSLWLAGIFLTANYMTIRGGLNQTTTIGGIVLINGYLLQLLKPLESFGLLYRNLFHGYAEYTAIEFCLNEEDKITSTPFRSDCSLPSIRFEHFSKAGIIDDFNLDISQAQSIAIVGKTGSGKTTILNALSGLDSDYQGTISINDNDIKTMTPQQLQSFIAYLPSDARLLTMSTRDNLLLHGIESAVDIDSILINTILQERINNLGLDTIITEQSHLLSQGEKQRLKIARVLLTDRRILLLDEITSALDPITEEKIVHYLINNNKGIMMYVTHKYTHLKHFDQILLLQEGKIIAQGNHHKLITEHEEYQQLWQAQQAI